MRQRFPAWLDAPTLRWAADYCEAMARRLPSSRLRPAVAAEVCAIGLRQAIEIRGPQPPPPRPAVAWVRDDA